MVLVGVVVDDRHGVTSSNGVVLVRVVFRWRLLTVGVVLTMWCSLTVMEWLLFIGSCRSLSWLLASLASRAITVPCWCLGPCWWVWARDGRRSLACPARDRHRAPACHRSRGAGSAGAVGGREQSRGRRGAGMGSNGHHGATRADDRTWHARHAMSTGGAVRSGSGWFSLPVEFTVMCPVVDGVGTPAGDGGWP